MEITNVNNFLLLLVCVRVAMLHGSVSSSSFGCEEGEHNGMKKKISFVRIHIFITGASQPVLQEM